MKSELSKEKFESRLAELTSPEKSFFVITPYDFSGKPFCGTFNQSTFELTKNSFWLHIKGIKISGEYRQIDNNNTEVIYEIGKVSNTSRNAFLTIFSLVFVGINGFLIYNIDKINPTIFFVFNGWLIFMSLFGVVIRQFSKFIVNQKFKEEFEIDIKPTDLYGYGGT